MEKHYTGHNCIVCKGPLVEEVRTGLTDSDIMTMEVGNERVFTTRELYCENCGLLYKHTPKQET
jgi:uncharacterized protein YbaR (Trm112 family)